MGSDFRVIILEEYSDLLVHWNERNSLYNSLRFYQLFADDVEHADIVDKEMIKCSVPMAKDIMTSWWTPIKLFIFRNNDGKRKEKTIELIGKIPKENNLAILTNAISIIRYKESGKFVMDDLMNTVEAMLNFLQAVYTIGNFTNAAYKNNKSGSLDNWDEKLEKIRREKTYEPLEWKKYVEKNYFQVFYQDKKYTKINNFWEHGPNNLGSAMDEEWKAYFENATKYIYNRYDLYKKEKTNKDR